MTVLTTDQLEYMAKVVEWLKACPDGSLAYGEFYVSKVVLSFSGDVIGEFQSDDPDWLFETKES